MNAMNAIPPITNEESQNGTAALDDGTNPDSNHIVQLADDGAAGAVANDTSSATEANFLDVLTAQFVSKHGRTPKRGEKDLLKGLALKAARPKGDEENGDNAPKFLVIEDMLLEAREPTTWVIENFIYDGALVMLHGREHTGKTYIALDIALRIASPNHDYHGFLIPEHRPVVYIASEGRKTASKRLASWLDLHDMYPTWIDLPSVEGLLTMVVAGDAREAREASQLAEASMPFYRYDVPDDFTLNAKDINSKKAVKDLAEIMLALELLWGIKPVVIFDVVSDMAPEVDENSREFGHALALLKPDKLNAAATILVHHEGLADAGRARGHSSQLGLVDIRIPIDAKSDNYENPTLTHIKLWQAKNRDEDRTPPFILTLTKANPALKPVITGRPLEVLERIMLDGWKSKDAFGASGLTDVQRTILVAVRNDAQTVQETVEVTLAQLAQRTGIRKATAGDNRDKLISDGYLLPGKTQGSMVLTETGWELTEDDAA